MGFSFFAKVGMQAKLAASSISGTNIKTLLMKACIPRSRFGTFCFVLGGPGQGRNINQGWH